MTYSLVLPFDTEDPEFARGFEAGRLWERIKSGEVFVQMIHATNAEMVMRMCESEEREFRAEDVDDIWVEVEVS